MSANTQNTRTTFELNGQQVTPPEGWTDIAVTASFDNDAIQANINFDSFRFVNVDTSKPSNILRGRALDSSPGIFEGVPFKINGINNNNARIVFDGFVNMTKDFVFNEDGSTVSGIQKKDGLNTLEERLEALTWGLLEIKGDVTSSDYTVIDFVSEKKVSLFELLITNVVLFLMIKELIESIRALAEQVNDAFGHGTGGLSGSVAAAAWTIAQILITAIYTALIAIAVFNLGKELFETLLPKVRQHRVIQLRRAMEIVATKLGYGFVAPTISELDDVYFLPSNPRDDDASLVTGLITIKKGTATGIPRVSDVGYNCKDFFTTIKDMVDGKFAIIGSDIHFRPFNDPFWIKNSTWVMPDVLIEQQGFNTDELFARWALLFREDVQDKYTGDNYLGTAFEVGTDQINTVNEKAKYIRGLDEINIPWALGNRKDNFTGLENVIKNVLQFLDNVVNTFGASSNLASFVTNKIGMLKVSDNNHTVPKLLHLTGGRLPVNHRELFKAKVMWDKYHNDKSFVLNNFGRQRLVFKEVKVPFGLEDLLILIDNSYFTDNENRLGKITNINWNMFNDFATVSWWVHEVYDTNLDHFFIEQP